VLDYDASMWCRALRHRILSVGFLALSLATAGCAKQEQETTDPDARYDAAARRRPEVTPRNPAIMASSQVCGLPPVVEVPPTLSATELFRKAASEWPDPTNYCSLDAKSRLEQSRRAVAWIKPLLARSVVELATRLPEYGVMTKLTEQVLQRNSSGLNFVGALSELLAQGIDEAACRTNRTPRALLFEVMTLVVDGDALYEASFALAATPWPTQWCDYRDRASQELRAGLAKMLMDRSTQGLEPVGVSRKPTGVEIVVESDFWSVELASVRERKKALAMTGTVDIGDVLVLNLDVRANPRGTVLRSESIRPKQIPSCILTTWSEGLLDESSTGKVYDVTSVASLSVDVPVFLVTQDCSASEEMVLELVSSDHDPVDIRVKLSPNLQMSALRVSDVEIDQDFAGYSDVPSRGGTGGVDPFYRSEVRIAGTVDGVFDRWELKEPRMAVAADESLMQVETDGVDGRMWLLGRGVGIPARGDIDLRAANRSFWTGFSARDTRVPLSNGRNSIWIKVIAQGIETAGSGATADEGDGDRRGRKRRAGDNPRTTTPQQVAASTTLREILASGPVQVGGLKEAREAAARMLKAGAMSRDAYSTVISTLDAAEIKPNTKARSLARDLFVAEALLEAGVSFRMIRGFVDDAVRARTRSVVDSIRSAAGILVSQGGGSLSERELDEATDGLVDLVFNPQSASVPTYQVVRYLEVPLGVSGGG